MLSNTLKLQYYKVAFMAINRSCKNGKYNNAKPLLLLSIFEGIDRNLIIDNKIFYDKNLKCLYEENCKRYESDKDMTPIVYPFYHIRRDGFVNLIEYSNDLKYPPTPSDKYIREHIKYATMDNALWDLLQDEASRMILKDVVINHFLTGK